MPTLSTGYIIVGAYADKLRKTLFAQQKEKIKTKEIDPKELARAAAEVNRLLFEILVNKLQLDKGDVVRVRIDYELTENNEVNWNYGTLTIEAFRREDQEKINEVVNEVVKKAEEILKGLRERYEIKHLGTSDLGDEIFEIVENDERVGVIVATPVNQKSLIRGALLNPPKIIQRQEIKVGKENLESYLRENIGRIISNATETEEEKAKEIIEDALKLLS